MKNPNSMTTEKIVQWLGKTSISMSNAWNADQFRKCDLVDRFEELKEEAVERGFWVKWCNENFVSTEADGWDFFA